MADKKISQLDASSVPLAGTEELPIVQSGVTKKVSVANLTAGRAVSLGDVSYTGTLTGGTGVVNLGSGQFYKDASGNVGIKTSSPRTELNVHGVLESGSASSHATGSVMLRARNTGANVNFANTWGSLRSSGASYMGFCVKPSTLADNTFVGGVNATVGVSAIIASNGFVSFQTGANQAITEDGAITIAERMRITNTGVIQFNAYGAGTLSTNASGEISASDGRYKTKTRSVENGLDAIAALQPTYFKWDEDSPFASENEELGFIAQEVAAAIPEASPGEDEEGKFRNYHDRAIIAMLVKGMQELKAEVDSLKSQLEGN